MNLDSMKNNPIVLEWKKTYNAQTLQVQQKLDKLKNMDSREYQLIVIKRNKNVILKDGDIFVLSPRKDIFFYGKVLKASIENQEEDSFLNGKSLIFIFQCKTHNMIINKFKPDYNKLLITPVIVDRSYWTKGFFYTIGNIEITAKEKKLDYGFYRILKDKYYKEDNSLLNKKPKISSMYGVSTISGIAYEIEKQLIINPNILEF